MTYRAMITGALCAIVALADHQPVLSAVVFQSIEDRVAEDAVVRYDIIKREGEPVSVCVHAGLVAAAYLQAKNESSYRNWKQIERNDCAIAKSTANNERAKAEITEMKAEEALRKTP